MTSDKVETRIGTLNFVDGVPTAETTALVHDHLDFLRGVEMFLNFIPAASMEGYASASSNWPQPRAINSSF